MNKKYSMLVFSFLCTVQAHAAIIILPNGTKVDGSEVRAKANGDIILTTPNGQRIFTKGTYTKVQADKPAGYDEAIRAAREGRHDEAIGALEKIAQEYRFLEWDNTALGAIAQIQASRGNHKDAVDAYERLFRQSPELKTDAGLQGSYRTALLDAGMHDKLMPMLEQAISSGSRAEAAKAQIMRGDIRLSRGETEAAIMDYLRTSILFESEAAVHPESLYKAGEALEKIRDARSKDMSRRLIEKYPQSEFAQKARGRI